MAAEDSFPEIIQLRKGDGSHYSRLEMEQQILDVWARPLHMQIQAVRFLGLNPIAVYGMLPGVCRHYILDELVRRGDVVGASADVDPVNHMNPEQHALFIQKLGALVWTGPALPPIQGDGIVANIPAPPQVPAVAPPPFAQGGFTPPTPPAYPQQGFPSQGQQVPGVPQPPMAPPVPQQAAGFPPPPVPQPGQPPMPGQEEEKVRKTRAKQPPKVATEGVMPPAVVPAQPPVPQSQPGFPPPMPSPAQSFGAPPPAPQQSFQAPSFPPPAPPPPQAPQQAYQAPQVFQPQAPMPDPRIDQLLQIVQEQQAAIAELSKQVLMANTALSAMFTHQPGYGALFFQQGGTFDLRTALAALGVNFS